MFLGVSSCVSVGYCDLRKNIPSAPEMMARTPPAMSQMALSDGVPLTACVTDELNEFEALMP
jgi:hypothetical protein